MAKGESLVKFRGNQCGSFDVILLADRQKDGQMNNQTNI